MWRRATRKTRCAGFDVIIAKPVQQQVHNETIAHLLLDDRPVPAAGTSRQPSLPAAIREEIGSHFDPDVVEAFTAIEDQLRAVAESLADGY